jgi:phage protein D
MGLFLNDIHAHSVTQAPRLQVLLNGTALPGALSATVTQTNTYRCSRYTATFAPQASGTGTAKWWLELPAFSDAQMIDVRVVNADGGQAASIIQGEIDTVELDTETFTVRIAGRDLAARLIDHRSDETTLTSFKNKSAGEIVTALAAQHGLTANVVGGPSGFVGRMWQPDTSALQLSTLHAGSTDWETVVTLAKQYGYDVYVTGTTLNFAPPPSKDATPYGLLWAMQGGVQIGNAIGLHMSRGLQITRGVRVIVQSWSAKQKRGFQRIAGPALINSPSVSRLQAYVVTRPDLNEDQAQQLANSLYEEITKHECRISCRGMRGDTILTPWVPILLAGTGTVFDQTYFPVSVTRHLSATEYTMDFEARNHTQAVEDAAGGA